MNKVVLVGRLGENAEVIETKNGNIMIKLVLATRDRDQTDWHQIKIVDNKLALTCTKCSKNQLVSISGKIKTKKHIDSRNITHYSTYIEAEDVIFLSPLNTTPVTETKVGTND